MLSLQYGTVRLVYGQTAKWIFIIFTGTVAKASTSTRLLTRLGNGTIKTHHHACYHPENRTLLSASIHKSCRTLETMVHNRWSSAHHHLVRQWQRAQDNENLLETGWDATGCIAGIRYGASSYQPERSCKSGKTNQLGRKLDDDRLCVHRAECVVVASFLARATNPNGAQARPGWQAILFTNTFLIKVDRCTAVSEEEDGLNQSMATFDTLARWFNSVRLGMVTFN